MQLGEVIDYKINEVKGYDYDVRDFLGPVEFNTRVSFYIIFIKISKEDMRLYMVVISLWPGNYHGFHSPANWSVKEIVNIPGNFYF